MPIRNTTGRTVELNIFGSIGSRSQRAPRGQVWHVDRPDHHALTARSETLDPQFAIDRAQGFIDSCAQAVHRQQALPQAQLPGRSQRYFNACTSALAGAFGLGMGEQPKFKPSWARPDKPLPAERSHSPTHELPPSAALRQATQHRKQLERQVNYLQSVHVQLQSDLQTVADLEQKINQLPAMLASLEPQLEAAKRQEISLADSISQQKNQQLELNLTTPCGFEHNPQAGAVLQAGFQALLARLQDQSVQDGLVPARSFWSSHEVVPVLSHALSIVTQGDPVAAAELLRQLMRTPFQSLVPQVGKALSGHTLTVARPNQLVSPLEKLVAVMVDLPTGTQQLVRMSAPAGVPPTPAQREALHVYYRATEALNITPDSTSRVWLLAAAQAACEVMHTPHEPGALILEPDRQHAFNGVRNGYLSVALGSAYDKAQQHLTDLSLEWIERAQEASYRSSPLHAMSQAVTVANQVGLPTYSHQLDHLLQPACEQLIQLVASRLQTHCTAEQGTELKKLAKILDHLQKRTHGSRLLGEVRFKSWRRLDRQARNMGASQLPPLVSASGEHYDVNKLKHRVRALHTLLAAQQKYVEITGIQADVESPSAAHPAPAENSSDAISEPADSSDSAKHSVSSNATLPESTVLAQVAQCLNQAKNLSQEFNTFSGAELAFLFEDIEKWITPPIAHKSSSVAIQHGTSGGLSTRGLSSTVNFVNKTGAILRLDLQALLGTQSEMRWSRGTRGMEIFAGQAQKISGRYGGGVGVGYSLWGNHNDSGLNDGLGASLVGSWSQTHSLKNTQGVVVRAPKFGTKSQSEVTQEFTNIVNTLFNWRTLDPTLADPLEALLIRHPQVSVSTLEKLHTVSRATRSGISAGASYTGPVSGEEGFLASQGVVLGVATERKQDHTQYKTEQGTQGFVTNTNARAHTVTGSLTLPGQVGGVLDRFGADNGDAALLRCRTSSLATVELELHRKSAQAQTTLIRQPDGTLDGERAVEYNTYALFEAAVKPHWDVWISRGMSQTKFTEPHLSLAQKRLIVEADLKAFMDRAETNLRKGGTVTLDETMDIRPDVCAELASIMARQAMAEKFGSHQESQALANQCQALLEDDSSYVPYRLKARVRSSAERGSGLDLILQFKRAKEAQAMHEYDAFPAS